jgi:biotin carboxyl carrier protein
MVRNITFEFQGFVYDVQAERKGDVLTLTHNGASYPVNLAPGKAQTVSNDYLSAVPKGGAAAAGLAVSAAPVAAVAAPAPAASAPAPVAPAPVPAAGGSAELAPITGTVKEIKVSPGQSVNQGQLVILMEAMKMDIEVFASVTGTVGAVLVKPGDSVTDKQALINWA